MTNLSEKPQYLEQISVKYVKENARYQLMPFPLRKHIFKSRVDLGLWRKSAVKQHNV